MTPRIVTVLRSGGDYLPQHVERLRRQCAVHAPDLPFLCLSDCGIGRPLEHGWPGWWSKMEIFRPGLTGPLLFMDLDSAIVGDLSDMAGVGQITMMRDVYRPHGLQSSVMFLPEECRDEVWHAWIADPERWMHMFRRGGDQTFLESLWLHKAARWQDVLPGQVVSFKADVRGRAVPKDARFVAFHGRPRPWEVEW